jgi:ABC-type spermidine/putrescine transport systems, ATPase components
MDMEHAHVAIRNVSKKFGSFKALDNVSLEIAQGSFTTLLGPSGCGKTTLLRSIAGFYQIDGGEILIDDRVINNVPSHLRNAIMVFQDYALFPHMTIRENITYGLRIRKMPQRRDRDAGSRRRSTTSISGCCSTACRARSSGGQQQRVALARALIMEPEVLLLDEPLSNLDANLRNSIRAELRQLQQRLRITTIYVTHDQSEALAMSDSIAVLNAGKIMQIGSPCGDLLSSCQQVRRFVRRHRQLHRGEHHGYRRAAYSRRGERSSDTDRAQEVRCRSHRESRTVEEGPPRHQT